MKNQLIFLLVLMTFAGLHSASAQVRFAPQLGYVAVGDGAVQVGANAEFRVDDRFRIQPSLNYYFINHQVSGISYTYWSLDADGHYYFTSDPSIKLYMLVGLNYLGTKIESNGVSVDNSKFGVNLGVGANFVTKSNLTPFLEAKYNSAWNGLVVTAGLRFGRD